jgi:molybdopterin-guanine dinucleotide biosynthesis protein A
MSFAGFVLVGGRSSRMGQDKALLPFRGRTLVEHVAGEVRRTAGGVSLIGDAAIYSYLGFPVIQDSYPGRGPLSGIHAALNGSHAEWHLVVACDMPELTAEFLQSLAARAAQSGADAVIPAGPAGRPEPLCAAYHRRCLAAVENALGRDIRKVMDALVDLEVELWHVPESKYFHNLNTRQEWLCYSNA